MCHWQAKSAGVTRNRDCFSNSAKGFFATTEWIPNRAAALADCAWHWHTRQWHTRQWNATATTRLPYRNWFAVGGKG